MKTPISDPPDHLDDSRLQVYLDRETDPQEIPRIEAHLSDCLECAERLNDIRTFYARIESLPDVRLERDLAPTILAKINPSDVEVNPVTASPMGRTAWVLLAMQALLALVLLIPAWQLLQRAQVLENAVNLIGGLTLPSFDSLPAGVEFFRAQLTSLQTIAKETLLWLKQPFPIPVPFTNLLILVAASVLLWLVGNGVLISNRNNHSLFFPNSSSQQRRDS